MKVVLSDRAKNDLMEIGLRIHAHSPRAAARIVNEILDACESIADMPARHSRIPRFEHEDLRRRAFRKYVIAYRFDAERVDIVRIIPGAMDIDRVLFGIDDEETG